MFLYVPVPFLYVLSVWIFIQSFYLCKCQKLNSHVNNGNL
nr:MAG TPA: hypothetical protein [Bacteriophage sp.]